jgi:hypothetical protein
MTLYSRILTYSGILVVLLGITYALYLYFFAPIPGDTTSVVSKTFRKNTPVNTNTENVIARNVKMTETGAFSFLFGIDDVVDHPDTDPIMYPILSFNKSNSPVNSGPISVSVLYNRLSSDILIGFYNSSGDIYTVPISTAMYKEKLSIAIRLMNTGDTTSFLANIYLNGEYIASRGIPNAFVPTGGIEHTIIAGTNNGIQGRLQTIRVWDNAVDLTDEDFMKISKDPFSL